MRAAVMLGVLAHAVVAHAQPSQPQPVPPAAPLPLPPAPVPPPQVPPPVGGDDAWRAYDDAFATAADGNVDAAKSQLLQLQTRWPGHPASVRGGSLVGASSIGRVLDPDAPSRVARGELVFWSTVGGVFVAMNVCEILGCESDRETAGVYIASVGGALGLSVLASQHGVRNGEAQLYNSSQTWGAWNGIMLADETNSDASAAGIALASQGLGLVAGIGLWQVWRPTQGDVALTNTAFLWTTVLSVWAQLASNGDVTLRRAVISGDIGIVAGALLSTQVKMSRGRTLLIDLGGVLGIMGGGLVAVSQDGDDEAFGAALLVGTAAGLAIAVLATDDWDTPPVTVPVQPMPIAGPSGSVGLGLGTQLAF